MLSYPSGITLSTRSLNHLAGLIRAHRLERRSRLAHLRNGDTYARLAAGFGIGTATVYRYVAEAVDLLAATAPDLTTAMRRIRELALVILDGTLVLIDRIRGSKDRAHYSGKHKRHGVNVRVIADPAGRLVWASPALPGATHDLSAAREHGIIAALTEAAVLTLADKAYRGAGPAVRVPFYGKDLPTRDARVQQLPQPHPRTRRTRQRHPQDLETAHQTALLPATCTAIIAAILVLHQAEEQE